MQKNKSVWYYISNNIFSNVTQLSVWYECVFKKKCVLYVVNIMWVPWFPK